jgi:hypothetical protein
MRREEGLNPLEQVLALFPLARAKVFRCLVRQHDGIGRVRGVPCVKQGELRGLGPIVQRTNGLRRILRSIDRQYCVPSIAGPLHREHSRVISMTRWRLSGSPEAAASTKGSRNVASWRRRVSSEGWKSRRDVRKFSEGARERSVDYGEEETMPWVSAYLIKSAVVLRLRCSMICPLWNSTVREETFKRLAISLAVRPSTRSCRISR